ncbi:MAG: hypothetical protein J1E35_06670 [Lachnospiraceae bacterium]|nr:hypothetical protein [Lachnospiraceae bacterium]
MNGVHGFGAFRKDFREMMGGKNVLDRRAPGKPKRPGGEAAAKYEMSDKAKRMGHDAMKEYQKKAGGLQMEKNKKAENEVELSEAAKNLLAQLKEKYGNIDFFVAEFSSDEEAQYYHNQSTKQYSCVIDPHTLEEMAADDAVKEKYVNIIDTAGEQFDKLKEDLGEDAKQVKRMGVTVDKDGVVSYFVELTKQTERNQKALMDEQKARKAEDKARAEKTERKRAEQKDKAEKEKGKEGALGNLFKVSANTIEELTEKLKQLFAERAEGKGESGREKSDKKQERPHFDMTM